jgi:hypothetical protein
LGVAHPPPSLVFKESPIWRSSFSLFCCLHTTLTTKTSTTGKHLAGDEKPAKVHILTYKLPPKPQHGRTKLSLKPQHRYPLNPNIRSSAKAGNSDEPFQEFSLRSQASRPTTIP